MIFYDLIIWHAWWIVFYGSLEFLSVSKSAEQIIGLQSNQVTCKINSAQETKFKSCKRKRVEQNCVRIIQSSKKSDIIKITLVKSDYIVLVGQGYFLHLICFRCFGFHHVFCITVTVLEIKINRSLDILIDSKHTAKIQMYDREVAKIKVLSETGYIYERRKTHFKRGSLIIHIDQTSRHQHHFVDCAVHKNKQHTYKSTTVK